MIYFLAYIGVQCVNIIPKAPLNLHVHHNKNHISIPHTVYIIHFLFYIQYTFLLFPSQKLVSTNKHSVILLNKKYNHQTNTLLLYYIPFTSKSVYSYIHTHTIQARYEYYVQKRIHMLHNFGIYKICLYTAVKEWPISWTTEQQRAYMKKNGDERKGYVMEDLLDFISYHNICPDDLHLRIRISTKLFNQVTVYQYSYYTVNKLVGNIYHICLCFTACHMGH